MFPRSSSSSFSSSFSSFSSSSSSRRSASVLPGVYFIHSKTSASLLGAFKVDSVYYHNDVCYWVVDAAVFLSEPVAIGGQDLQVKNAIFKKLKPSVELAAKLADSGTGDKLCHFF